MLLTPEGDLYLIDPDALEGSEDQVPVLSINPGAISANNVYDIDTNSTVSFGLSSGAMRYGDLALFRPSASSGQLMITGTSQSSSKPFVLDITTDNQLNVMAAQIVLTSTAASGIAENRPRGVAVNDQGVGLTTLPVSDPSNPSETIEVAVMFPVDTSHLAQPEVLFDALDLPSEGMTTNTAGDFYIASGEMGSSECGSNLSGALIVIPTNSNGLPLGALNQLTCFPIATTMDPFVSSRDVAVSPADQSVYVTLNNLDQAVTASQP